MCWERGVANECSDRGGARGVAWAEAVREDWREIEVIP